MASQSDHASVEGGSISVNEAPAVQQANPSRVELPKKAEPPHRLTLIASFGAMALSICSLAVSLIQSKTQQANLVIAEANLRASQRPFVEVAWGLKSDLNKLPANASPRKIAFLITLKNTGNTVARGVHCDPKILTLAGGAESRVLDQGSCGGVSLDRGMRRMFDISASLTPQEWGQFRRKQKHLELVLGISYEDKFGQEFRAPFYLFLEGDGSSNVPLGY